MHQAALPRLPIDRIRALAKRRGVEPMPIEDQMRLQLEYLQAGLDAVVAQAPA